MKSAVLIASIALLGAAPVRASVKAAAQAKAAKGPVQISFILQKTTVKVRESLFYKLELKNVGKKKMLVHDWIFKNPWAMYENCRTKRGIYFEIIGPDNKPLLHRLGGERPQYDWEPRAGELLPYTSEERKEIAALRADGKKRGLTDRQITLAINDWNNENNSKKNQAELSDPAKQLWLRPGASTATFAWMDRGPDEYEGRAADDETLAAGYTELWSYTFFHPGKYRIRAVYDRAYAERTKKRFKKIGITPSPEAIEFKTEFIDLEVVP